MSGSTRPEPAEGATVGGVLDDETEGVFPPATTKAADTDDTLGGAVRATFEGGASDVPLELVVAVVTEGVFPPATAEVTGADEIVGGGVARVTSESGASEVPLEVVVAVGGVETAGGVVSLGGVTTVPNGAEVVSGSVRSVTVDWSDLADEVCGHPLAEWPLVPQLAHAPL